MIMDKERLTTAGIDIDGALERFAGNEESTKNIFSVFRQTRIWQL